MNKHRHLQTCFYCDVVFSTARSAEGDHFPVPRRHGGKQTVPCCRACHELKDNLSMNDWSLQMVAEVVKDVPRFNRFTRIFLAKAMMMYLDISADLENAKEAA